MRDHVLQYMVMKNGESCKACEFSLEEKPGHYTCRRYPPLNHYEPVIIENPVSRFPQVRAEDWCAEYKKKSK